VALEHADACLLSIKDFHYADVTLDVVILLLDLQFCHFCLFRKPKNQRVKRALEKRESKIYENDKTAVFVRGGHTSEIVTQFLSELVIDKLFSLYIISNSIT